MLNETQKARVCEAYEAMVKFKESLKKSELRGDSFINNEGELFLHVEDDFYNVYRIPNSSEGEISGTLDKALKAIDDCVGKRKAKDAEEIKREIAALEARLKELEGE